MNNFAYQELENFLCFMKQKGSVVSFRDYVNDKPTKGIILRHDIDLDFFPSVDVSHIEKKVGVRATFFILVTSKTYNILSPNIRKFLECMIDDGFEIGLHFDPSIYGMVSQTELHHKLKEECSILKGVTGEPVKSISLHNPSLSGEYPKFDGFNNAYDKEFFCDERYISDSMRIISSIHPYRGKDPYDFINNAKSFPLQVVLHPEQFLRDGGDYIDTISRYNSYQLNSVLHDYYDVIEKTKGVKN
jgi:hypothetical protein